MTIRTALSALLFASLLGACSGGTEHADAGQDGGVDASIPHHVDAHVPPPMCTPDCGGEQSCCANPDGTTECATLRNDPHHCGICPIDCVTTHRGDTCENFQCICGNAAATCTGNRNSYCCPPRQPGTAPYCANLDLSPSDCGACDTHCDPAKSDRCDGGHCVCGTRTACDGTATSLCCSNGVDALCADTTTDHLNCGACNHACEATQRCENGICTLGSSCPSACDPTEICCNGDCCAANHCIGSTCTATPDAGVTDAA